jgi:hypothetical protein
LLGPRECPFEAPLPIRCENEFSGRAKERCVRGQHQARIFVALVCAQERPCCIQFPQPQVRKDQAG